MIIVMGLPGAGKSTILSKVKEGGTEYEIVNYGDLMLKIEQEKGWVKTRDEMRKLPIEKQKQAQKLVAKWLANHKEKLILDTHCAVNTPSGYYPGLPFAFLKGLKIEKLVYITANVGEIIARRQNDPTRVRDSNDNIAEHDEMNRCYLAAYSAFTGAPSVIIYNTQGKLDESAARVKKLL